MGLIEPHGGKLINRVLLGKELEKALKYAASLRRVDVSLEVMQDIVNIATGVFSPLEGFVSKEDYENIVNHKKLSNGISWTIPIIFPIVEKTNNGLKENEDVAIYYENKLRAIFHLKEKYVINKKETFQKVYGTEDLNHPGVRKLLESGSTVLSGEVDLLDRSVSSDEITCLDPAEMRGIILKKGWKTVVGFQTRNPPHRAHEYLQRTALESADGLFIQPLIGWKKKGDFKPKAISNAYRALIDNYYPSERVVLGFLITSMRYAGPREAVFHAIIRKNFGCTHFIVGRDHAGVGDYYDKYAAHKIFDEVSDLGITVLRLCGPYYCRKCNHLVTEKTCRHSQEYTQEISGTSIRQFLQDKRPMPSHFMRPEVLSVLSEDDLIS